MGTMNVPYVETRDHARARVPASILAIGTANPETCFPQADFPDHYFRVTESEHMTNLKQKFVRICDKSMVKNRHLLLTEEFLKDNPTMCSYDDPSLNARQDALIQNIPKMAAEAASKAIEEWRQPKSKITHLVVCSMVASEMPGLDVKLITLLRLNPSVKRVLLHHQSCYAGGTVLRVAKDLAENNPDARVLVICVETHLITFRGPSQDNLSALIAQALFADGAAALIIGAGPIDGVEQPIFQIASTAVTIVPDTENCLRVMFRDSGTMVGLSDDAPTVIADHIEKCLTEVFGPVDVTDWNSIFWATHPGGPKILDKIEAKLGLSKEKFGATRHVLQEYGNMSSSTVLFILDHMRRKLKEDRLVTTGEGLKWGVVFGLGPGITIETVLLRSCPTT